MSTELAFLAAIRAHPADDLPRLVYADWLEEHGQSERAEFIRVECEAAMIDRDSPAYPALLGRSDRRGPVAPRVARHGETIGMPSSPLR